MARARDPPRTARASHLASLPIHLARSTSFPHRIVSRLNSAFRPFRRSARPPVRHSTPAASSSSVPPARGSADDPHSAPRPCPVFVTIRYPPASSPSSVATSAANLSSRPSSRSPSAPLASRTAAMCFVGITSTCVGARGSTSRKATALLRSFHDRRRDLARHDPAEQTVSHRLLRSRPATAAAAAAIAAVSNLQRVRAQAHRRVARAAKPLQLVRE